MSALHDIQSKKNYGFVKLMVNLDIFIAGNNIPL